MIEYHRQHISKHVIKQAIADALGEGGEQEGPGDDAPGDARSSGAAESGQGLSPRLSQPRRRSTAADKTEAPLRPRQGLEASQHSNGDYPAGADGGGENERGKDKSPVFALGGLGESRPVSLCPYCCSF